MFWTRTDPINNRASSVLLLFSGSYCCCCDDDICEDSVIVWDCDGCY